MVAHDSGLDQLIQEDFYQGAEGFLRASEEARELLSRPETIGSCVSRRRRCLNLIPACDAARVCSPNYYSRVQASFSRVLVIRACSSAGVASVLLEHHSGKKN